MGVEVHGRFLLHVLTFVSCFLTSAASINGSMGTCRYRNWSKPGTLIIQVIAGIHEATDDGKCSTTVSATTVDQLVMLDWMVDIINGQTEFSPKLISNHTIGM